MSQETKSLTSSSDIQTSEEEINKDCPCTWPGCPRHGKCKECQEYHHARGETTSCQK